MINEQTIISERRLHPLTLAYQAIRNIPAFLIPVYFAVFQGNREEWFYILISVFVLFFTVPSIILQYYYFKFYLTNREIVIRSGVFSKKTRNISLSRIQNINIEENILQRIFGLVKVEIETAGDSDTEGKLEYVSKQDAHDLKEIIKKYQYKLQKEKKSTSITWSSQLLEFENEEFRSKFVGNIESDIAVDNFSDGKERILFSMSLRDTAKYGMMRLRPVFLAVVAWLLGMVFQFQIIDFDDANVANEIRNFLETREFFGWLIFISGSVLLFLLLSWLMDIALTVNQFYGFKLTSDGKKLFTNYGLLTKRHTTIPLKKMQFFSIHTNPIKKLFNFYTMDIQTAGFGVGPKRSEAVIPFAGLEKLIKVASDIISFELPEEFNRVSKKTIRRIFIKYIIYITILSLGLYFIFDFGFWLYTASPLFLYLSILKWRYRGWKIIDDKIIIKEGYWIQRKTVIPINKIQTINISSNLFQRRLDLASLNIDTAGSFFRSNSSIIDLDRDEADEIMAILSDKFHSK